ncbi:MAG: hypothetical protein MAG551_01348 [Candidatus Scalindua arabica]|uniref:Uncharacterized protein n=1 Tax=Candidatus Scalindua arabica TaxID=1127984 RepID=A0A941W3L9_9BACT|nr:hypothetical protein [Candidatus Scalindua arabica]
MPDFISYNVPPIYRLTMNLRNSTITKFYISVNIVDTKIADKKAVTAMVIRFLEEKYYEN